MDIFLYVLSALIGACFGSFANLIIYRVPLGKSIVSPRSYCVDCNHQIRFYENIPILSCLILGAKCSKCKKSFGWRSLVVEVMMSLLFICLVKQYLGSYLMWEYLIFGFAMICISFIDIDHRIIPDSFNIGGLLIGLIGAAINPEREFLDALLGVLFGGGFFWLISYLYSEAKLVWAGETSNYWHGLVLF